MNTINPDIVKIFETNSIRISEKTTIPLTSNIDINEGKFIWDLLNQNKFKSTIEIGCAEGVSSLFICDAIKFNSGHHTIIDPNQSTQWGNAGIKALKKFGYINFDLLEQPSEFALPRLIEQMKKYDFGLIDGWHTFDQTIVDFFYLSRLVVKGGIIAIDDVSIPGVRRAVQFINNLPNFKFIGGINPLKISLKKEILEKGKSVMNFVTRPLGQRIQKEFLNFNVYDRPASKRLNFSMIAFKKMGEDQRPWNWHRDF